MTEKDRISQLANERGKTSIIDRDIIEQEIRRLIDSGLDLELAMKLVDFMIDWSAATNRDFGELIRACVRCMEM